MSGEPDHTWPAGEGPPGDETPNDLDPDGGRRETLIQTKIFGSIGLVVIVMAAIYAFTSYEDAGTVMLVLAAGLSLTCAVYLWTQVRKADARVAGGVDDAAHGAHESELYLPHSSVWPFWIGVGTFLISNGLLLGTWFLVPGAVVMLFGISGFVRQSRART